MAPAEAADRQFGKGEPFAKIAVDVLVFEETGRDRRGAQRLVHKGWRRSEANVQFATAAVVFVVAAPVPLRTLEVGQQIGKAPSFKSELPPLVVVPRVAAR